MTQIDSQGAAEHVASSNQPAMASWLRSLEQSWQASEAKAACKTAQAEQKAALRKVGLRRVQHRAVAIELPDADHAIVSDSSDNDVYSEGNDEGTGGSESNSSENESSEGESTTVDPQPRPVSVSSKLEAAIMDELEKGLMGYRCDQTQ